MKCRICGRNSNQKICDICDPGYDEFDDVYVSRKKKKKDRDLRIKRKRRQKEEEWQ